MKSKKGFTSVDEYMASLPKETQIVLKKLRAAIKASAPKARQKISYQIGAFELNGKNLVAFAGWKNHVSMYPVPSGSAAFNKEVARYIDGKGTLKFPLDEPLPLKLISKVVKYRIAENLKNTKTKYSSKK